MAKASDNLFPKVLITEGSAPSSPAAGGQALFIDSADHKLKRKNSSGTVTTVESAATGYTIKAKQLLYTANNLKFTTTSWAALVTSAGASVGTALDLTFSSSEVAVGDTIQVGIGCTWQNEAIDGYLTFGTLVSGSIVNTIYSSNRGLPGTWGIGGAYSNASGVGFYVVQSGDLSSGALTLRPLGQGASAGTKTVLAATPNGLLLWAKNLGPQ